MRWLNDVMTVFGVADPGTIIINRGMDIAQKGMALVSKPDPDVMALKLHIAELQQELVTSKQAYMAVYDALLELKRKAEQAERFEREAGKYALSKTDMGAFVYALKPEHAGTEPAHELCTTCFEQHIKSVLQPTNFNTLGCAKCGAKFLKSDGSSVGASVGYSSPRDKYSGY